MDFKALLLSLFISLLFQKSFSYPLKKAAIFLPISDRQNTEEEMISTSSVSYSILYYPRCEGMMGRYIVRNGKFLVTSGANSRGTDNIHNTYIFFQNCDKLNFHWSFCVNSQKFSNMRSILSKSAKNFFDNCLISLPF